MTEARLVVGPFNRVEGDLEVTLDVVERRVTRAQVNAPLYRGFERMLEGRDPRDALVITPRICGICSISQSAARTTSKLCSMTMMEWPASSSLRNARISLAMSSKCRPVVGSSNMKSVPRLANCCLLAVDAWAVSAKKPASFKRCASPPLKVGTGWPSFT